MKDELFVTLDNLEELMTIPTDAVPEVIEGRFVELAFLLMNKFCIEYKDEEYRIVDLECYFYNRNHRDISVHPRESEALCWYINDFGGIDLNFKSEIKQELDPEKKKPTRKYKLTDNSYFGGILIRQVKRIADGELLDGPWKVADLFRCMRATSRVQENPILRMWDCPNELVPTRLPRKNLLGASKNARKKTEYNLETCFLKPYPDIDALAAELEKFNDEKYRFVLEGLA